MITKVEPLADVSPARLYPWTPGDWTVPVPPYSSSSHYDSKEDFSSSRQHDITEPNFERANRSGTFGINDDGNFDLNLMDNSELTDDIYSEVLYNMDDKSSIPYDMDINGPSYSGSQSVIYNNGMLYDDKIASGSSTFLPSSESSTETPARFSTNGSQYPSMLPSKRQIISIMDGTSDVGIEKKCDVADMFTDKSSLPSFYGVQNSHHFNNIRNIPVPPSQSYVHHDVLIKKQHVSIKEETESKFAAFTSMSSMPPKVGQQEFRENVTYIDLDDPDICILEDMSGTSMKQSPVLGKSPINVPLRAPIGVPPVHAGYNHARVKPNDEHIVYRAALQVSLVNKDHKLHVI